MISKKNIAILRLTAGLVIFIERNTTLGLPVKFRTIDTMVYELGSIYHSHKKG